MKKQYIKPMIEVFKQVYSEGLMDSVSIPIDNSTVSTGVDAKPGGEWGDVWSEPTTNTTTEYDNWGM